MKKKKKIKPPPRTKEELLARLGKYPLLRLSSRIHGCWLIDSAKYPTLNIGGTGCNIEEVHKKLDECEKNPFWVTKWTYMTGY